MTSVLGISSWTLDVRIKEAVRRCFFQDENVCTVANGIANKIFHVLSQLQINKIELNLGWGALGYLDLEALSMVADSLRRKKTVVLSIHADAFFRPESLDLDVLYVEKLLRMMPSLGIPTLVIHSLKFAENRESTLWWNTLKTILETASDLKVKIAVENMEKPGYIVRTVNDIADMFRLFNSNYLGLALDLSHLCHLSDNKPFQFLTNLVGTVGKQDLERRVLEVHVSDNIIGGIEGGHNALGAGLGVERMKELIKRTCNLCPDVPYILELDPLFDDYVEDSLTFLRKSLEP